MSTNKNEQPSTAQSEAKNALPQSIHSEQLALIAQMFQNIPEGVFIINGQGTFEFANPMAAQLLGDNQEALIGQNILHYLHDTDRDKYMYTLLSWLDHKDSPISLGPNEVKIMMNNASAVSEYYNRKKCYYINVGTHGFFLLGNRDPLKLNKAMRDLGYTKVIPDFGASAKCMIRVRVHDKSRSGPSGESFFEGAEDRVGGYQFTMTLQFSNVTKSPYNIAPLVAGSKSQIDLKRLKADKLLCAWL